MVVGYMTKVLTGGVEVTRLTSSEKISEFQPVGGDWNIGEMYGLMYGLMMVNDG